MIKYERVLLYTVNLFERFQTLFIQHVKLIISLNNPKLIFKLMNKFIYTYMLIQKVYAQTTSTTEYYSTSVRKMYPDELNQIGLIPDPSFSILLRTLYITKFFR